MGKISPSVKRYIVSLFFFGIGMVLVRQYGRTGVWLVVFALVVFYGGLWVIRRRGQGKE